MNLSICIITKNEEQNIDRCLKALAPYGLETIVVDTGSTDRSKQIAARYTDRLYDFPWCDDFSAAKNFAIEKASHSYVLVLDSDEFVEQLDLSALEKQIAAHPGAVGRIRRRNVFHRNGEEQENREWINRIFAKEYFHYEGRIHEQVTPLRGAESGYRTYETPVVILHTGYDLPEQQKKEKAERNIRLLEQELKQLGWDGNAGAKDGGAKAGTAGTDADACGSGQIEGAYKEGSRWWIPVDVERPGEEECLRRMRAYTVRITGKKSVAVGIQDFEALRRDQMFYVDKTDFIRQWWESGETTTLITRPRRFGKTLNLSMLNCFFSVFYENRADLFEGLKVWEEKSYHKLQGRFPVIFLSFAGVKGTTFEAVLRQINYGIIEVYRRFERILDMSRFTERERHIFSLYVK
mgnify:CR=1 FL=1